MEKTRQTTSEYGIIEAAREFALDRAPAASDLGYFDQSHLIRDFTRAVGMTPSAYAEACRAHDRGVPQVAMTT